MGNIMNINSCVNSFHAKLFRPENGYDPVPLAHAKAYADKKWDNGIREDLLNQIDAWVGGLRGKSVLDLGGGPGQYSIAMAKMGANVVWHDVSKFYMEYAKGKAIDHNVNIQFSLGYMDEAPLILKNQYDFVLNRICFNYGRSDSLFAQVIFDLIKSGGSCYIETNHSSWSKIKRSKNISSSFKIYLNNKGIIKIGHPFPRHGLVAELFNNKAIARMNVDYFSLEGKDQIFFEKL